MKRVLCLSCVVLLMLSACVRSDTYVDGVKQLENGDYAKAYELFKGSTDPRAAEELVKLVFVPLRESSTADFDNGKGTQNERQYTYDTNGNLIREETLFEGTKSLTEYTYNDKNLLMSVRYPGGETTYTYDEAGRRLTCVDELFEGGIYKEEYEYDGQGELVKTRITMRDGVKLVRYPQEEEPVQEPESNARCTYDDAGRLLAQTYSNGEKHEYAYDVDGNKISERYSWNDTVIEWEYEWVLQYYPNEMSEPVKVARERTIQSRTVA